MPAITGQMLRAFVLALLGMALAQAVPACAQGPYYNNGRTVGMGIGGEQIFFPYRNWNGEVVTGAALSTGQDFLNGFADPLTPAGASLTASERAIVKSIRLRRSFAATSGYRALWSGGQRYIDVPDEAAIFQLGLATSLYYSMVNDNDGFFNLFLMSEVDWWSQRSPRWYDPQVYGDWAGLPVSNGDMGEDDRFGGIIILVSGNMMLHEMCHHLLGHVDPPMITRFQQLDAAGRKALSIANELAADRCSAERGVAAGIPPDLAILLNLSSSIVLGDRPSNTHPSALARFEQARSYTPRALEVLRSYDGPGAQPLTMSDVKYAELIDGVYDQLLRYRDLYAP